jgi:hypothetical protein
VPFQRSVYRGSTAHWNVATSKISGIIWPYLSPIRLLPATVSASIGGGGDRWLYKQIWMYKDMTIEKYKKIGQGI